PDAPAIRRNRANYRSRLAAGTAKAARTSGPRWRPSPGFLEFRERHQMAQVKLYDTTLRDGMGGHGMSLSVGEKLKVVEALDALGAHFIEAGFPSSNPKEAELFERLADVELDNATIVAFGMTRRRDRAAADDEALTVLTSSFASAVCL